MSAEITASVEKAAQAYSEEYQRAIREAPSNRPLKGVSQGDAHHAFLSAHRAALAAALPTECHEAVVPEWADGEEMPCNSAHVVGFRSDDEGLYPVCAEHVREPMISLRTALLGADS